MRKIYALAAAFVISPLAHAVTDGGDRQITSFGIQGGVTSSLAYLTVSPPTSTNCLYGTVYIFNASESAAKPLVATALAAYTSGKPLKRIDYDVRPDGTCAITLLNF